MLGKEKQASLDIFSEVDNMELKFELPFAATCHWVGRVGKVSRLGRSRSSMQIPGIMSGERSAASSRNAGMQWPA